MGPYEPDEPRPKPTARGTHVLRIAASALAGLSLETLQKSLDADMLKRGITDKKVTIVADDSEEAERRVAQLIELRRHERYVRIGMMPQLGAVFGRHLRDNPEKVSAAEAKRARKNARRLADQTPQR